MPSPIATQTARVETVTVLITTTPTYPPIRATEDRPPYLSPVPTLTPTPIWIWDDRMTQGGSE